jgi:secreted trypsin-like serine protease
LEDTVSKDKHWDIVKSVLRRLERLGLVRKEIGTSRWIPQERLLFWVIAIVPILILLFGSVFLLRKNEELQSKLGGAYGEIERQRQHERELMSLVETSQKTSEEARRLAEAATQHRSKPTLSNRVAPRIVQHTNASIKDFPWHAGIIRAQATSNLDGYFCAGSVINPTWILTAAYCVNGTKRNEIRILTSTDNLQSGGTLSAVRRIVIHPQFKSSSNDNGIALINLANPIDALPISLLSTKREEKVLLPGTKVTMAGWGFIKENGSLSAKLHQIDVPIVARSECNGPNSYNGQITNNMICAGADGVVDACQGDGGAPLILKDDKKSFAVGVSGWGEGCGRVGKPGVYNRVSNQVNWISDIVSKD